MHSPLSNSFIFISKLMISISIFVSMNTHHWIRDIHGAHYQGLQLSCYDYGHLCYHKEELNRVLWFFYIIALLNVIFELLNILILCKRTRSRINLILEELGLLTTIVFILVATLIGVAGFIAIRTYNGERFDWSFYIFLLALILSIIEFICSLVRVVSYCRDNSFRSSVITYTSNTNNHETVHIQS